MWNNVDPVFIDFASLRTALIFYAISVGGGKKKGKGKK